MRLQDVEQKSQFAAYYADNKLQTIGDKIDNLTTTMEIIATRCDEKETQEEELAGLEELALQGFWKAT